MTYDSVDDPRIARQTAAMAATCLPTDLPTTSDLTTDFPPAVTGLATLLPRASDLEIDGLPAENLAWNYRYRCFVVALIQTGEAADETDDHRLMTTTMTSEESPVVVLLLMGKGSLRKSALGCRQPMGMSERLSS